MMRTIDLSTWSRREHYELFSTYGYPHWGMCANVDLTKFYPTVKQGGYSFTIAVVYMIARTANAVPAFRYRIRGDQVVEHELVHPGFTFLSEGMDAFSFCIVEYDPDFKRFSATALEQIDYIKANPWVRVPPQDDVLYSSAIPWVSFTSFLHPMHLQPEDSIPRFAWGKYFQEGERLKMPLAVQGHHALLDGVHAGAYYSKFQEFLDQPEIILGETG